MRLFAFALASSLLMAQTPQPAPIPFELELRLVQPRIYQQHERIPIEVQSKGPPFDQARAAREQWQFAGFRLDPAVDCGSETSRCYEHGLGRRNTMMIGGLNGPQISVRDGSHTSKTLLNYFMDLPPGQYRITAVVQKLVLTLQERTNSAYASPANPPEYIVSSPIDVTVQAATREWISQTIANSVAELRKAKEGEESRAAAQQLALLEGPEEWQAALDVLPNGEYILLDQFRGTSQPGPLCDLMQSRLAFPQQSVSSQYLNTLLDVCTAANGPKPPPAAATPAVKSVQVSAAPFAPNTPAPLSPETQQYLEKYASYRTDLMRKATATLASGLAQKTQDARLVALAALIAQANQLQYNRPPGPTPPWASIVTQEFIRILPSVPDMNRRQVISSYASTFDSPETARVLESVLDEWKPGSFYEGYREALAALYKADPKRAQARILAELKKPKTFLDVASLRYLPASEVPPMDDELIERVAIAQKAGYWDPALQFAAVATYATAEALPRLRKIYESQQDPCQPELAAYFLRVDAAYAARMLQASPAKCAQPYLARTAPLITPHAEFDAYVAPFLMNADVPIKADAAQTLGKIGSDAAVKPLWETFRYVRNYWEGKREELEKGVGTNLEVELRTAIARGQNWFTSEADLKTLASLCISRRCVSDAQRDVDIWKQPLAIEVRQEGAGISASIAQYYAMDTMEKLEQKIAQFPQGLEFKLSVIGPDKAELTERITTAARRAGLSLVVR